MENTKRRLDRDGVSLNRHRDPALGWSMIFLQEPVPTFRHALGMAMACAAVLFPPAPAHASGQMPILAVSVSFKSHQACVAALEEAYAEDRKQVIPLRVEADGDRREVSLTTKGVERIGPELALYDATVWYHNGGLRADLPERQIETSHSYEHRIRRCDGNTMRTSGEQGYTLSTFDPVDITDRPKP